MILGDLLGLKSQKLWRTKKFQRFPGVISKNLNRSVVEISPLLLVASGRNRPLLFDLIASGELIGFTFSLIRRMTRMPVAIKRLTIDMSHFRERTINAVLVEIKLMRSVASRILNWILIGILIGEI